MYRVVAKLILAVFCLVATARLAHAQNNSPRLYRSPSISSSHIAFLYADDIWMVTRTGGIAHRLTSSTDVHGRIFFSPDGRTIAYQAGALNNVYTIPASGGMPTHVTYYPSSNRLAGWSPDGKDLLVSRSDDGPPDASPLFRVRADGHGLPQRLPLPDAADSALSPDETRIAYNPFRQRTLWKHYQGGDAAPIWIVDLKTLHLDKVPRDNSNDVSPVWLGDTIYFLSDRSGPASLFSYDLRTKRVNQLLVNHGFDLKTLDGRGDALVYEQFGSIHIYDIATAKEHAVEIQLGSHLPSLETHVVSIGRDEIQNVNLSPTGAAAVVEAHGDIYTLPVGTRTVHNITDTPGAAERQPAWSADGTRIAYFSDATGEYKLYIANLTTPGPPTIIDLGPKPTYYFAPQWSSDNRHILFADAHENLWCLDIQDGSPVKVATNEPGTPPSSFGAAFSPDGQWILYVKQGKNLEGAAFLYSLRTHNSTQITNSTGDVRSAVFDASGKYIYLLVSTDDGPLVAEHLSSIDRITTAHVYVALLSSREPSPFAIKGTGQKSADGGQRESLPESAAHGSQEVDLEGIAQRTLPLPIPDRNYTALATGPAGTILVGESDPVMRASQPGGAALRSLLRFNLASRSFENVLHDVDNLAVSANSETLLYSKTGNWFVSAIDSLQVQTADGTPGTPLPVDLMRAHINPEAEWRQIFEESWRIEREFFYDPHLLGLDIQKVKERYAPFLSGLSTREDLTYLQTEMLAEIGTSHLYVRGPAAQSAQPTSCTSGLLGANYVTDNGRYRIAHILNAGSWNPELYAPLAQPGLGVSEGDYVLAINGKPLRSEDNLYAAFCGLSDKVTTITVSPNADGTGSHDVSLKPVSSEDRLRSREWIESELRKVSELSHDQIAYVYLPDTGNTGFREFNRYYYAQVGRKAVLVDDRYNTGGDIADNVLAALNMRPSILDTYREGSQLSDLRSIYGPKAMLINQSSMSGGDALPWLFHKMQLGSLVGTRTWGGLVNLSSSAPPLIDNGSITAPSMSMCTPQGVCEVENKGVTPDMEVELSPASVAAGHDPQLERAVSLLLAELKTHPPSPLPVPVYPRYHGGDGLGKE